MEVLILGDPREAMQWQLTLEDLNETWRCTVTATAAGALQWMDAKTFDTLLLGPGKPAEALLKHLRQSPPVCIPWICCWDWKHPLMDFSCTMDEASALARDMAFMQPYLPRLAEERLPRLNLLATELLLELDMPLTLRVWEFLPDMAAMCVMQPKLLDNVKRGIYAVCAERCRLTTACVERRLRIAVESTWNRSSIDTLDRYFGQTIDPERGKPTNKEFLAQLRVWMVQQLTQRAKTR